MFHIFILRQTNILKMSATPMSLAQNMLRMKHHPLSVAEEVAECDAENKCEYNDNNN